MLIIQKKNTIIMNKKKVGKTSRLFNPATSISMGEKGATGETMQSRTAVQLVWGVQMPHGQDIRHTICDDPRRVESTCSASD